MAENNTVCSMCGDVGFADKLFHCSRCHSRSQHSYCTNYYNENPWEIAGVCDWCLSEERSPTGAKHDHHHPKKLAASARGDHIIINSEQYSSDFNETTAKHSDVKVDNSGSRPGKSGAVSSSSSSSKSMGRRYKLLKDVLC